ncbi:BON domain-containing protein [Janthinobacterium sp. 17J80-10]|nr:BON domain-containing protein [Janthinobacterium sp. 17J80-10]
MSSGARSSGASTSGSAERAIDDSVITTKAKSALLADTTVKGTDINVETNRGIVSLSGMVDNDRQRDRAASIVRGIDGVKSVENKMTVKH